MCRAFDPPPWHAAMRDVPRVFARHRVHAATASVHEALSALVAERCEVLLVQDRGAMYVLTLPDLERVLPSPATTLARYEIPELLRRVAVRHAFGAPARTVRDDASLRDAVAALREGGWRPIVVLGGERAAGVVTAQSILAALAGDANEDRGAVPTAVARAG